MIKEPGMEKEKKGFSRIRQVGALFMAMSLLLFFVLFFPILREEIIYFFSEKKADEKIEIVSEKEPKYEKSLFSIPQEGWYIVIPKIGAVAPIIPQVDPYNEREYRVRLMEGVAHAKGSSVPGEEGNMFLFAHSSDSFYLSYSYNTIFYLLDKLEAGDFIYVIQDGLIYRYVVREHKIIRPNQVEYLTDDSDEQTITLMTCWPVGTVAKRLIIQGALEKVLDPVSDKRL